MLKVEEIKGKSVSIVGTLKLLRSIAFFDSLAIIATSFLTGIEYSAASSIARLNLIAL